MELGMVGHRDTIHVLEALRDILIRKISDAEKLQSDIEDLCCLLTDLEPISSDGEELSPHLIQQIRNLYSRFF